MPQFLRGRHALAASATAAAALFAPLAWAQTDSAAAAAAAPAPAASEPVANSTLDAPMFYQLLIGELELQSGQPGVAFQVLLDAARRSGDEVLFKRVVQIALQNRAGEQALTAAKAWRDTRPESLEAQRTVIQLLGLLNRPGEVAAPLRSMLALTPLEQRGALLMSLPGLFQRSPDARQVLTSLQPVLQDAADKPETRLAALLTQAQLALRANVLDQAMALTRSAATEYPQRDEPLQLALELLAQRAEAEPLIQQALKTEPERPGLRMAYARALARAQRSADAAREFRLLTEREPEQPGAWLGLGTLELELRHVDAAEAALQRFLGVLAQPAATQKLDEAAVQDSRRQAQLLLAQAAEMRGDLKTAEARLAEVDGGERAADIRYRRASLLARQGKLDQGLKLIRELPATTDQELRTRVAAEAPLLREQGRWQQAYDLLAEATQKMGADSPDVDLIYEQAMMAEKLERLDDMETLLRRVIALKPDHHHAYNALGYSLAERGLRLPEARELIVKALSLAPNEPFIVDSMGWVEFRLGRLDEAEKLLRQAYASRPDAEIAAHLGEVLWARGRKDEAQQVWSEGLRRDAKNEALLATMKRLKGQP